MFAAHVVQTEELSPIGSPIVNPSKSSQYVCADKDDKNETPNISVKIFFIKLLFLVENWIASLMKKSDFKKFLL